jgi:hypothetical protein
MPNHYNPLYEPPKFCDMCEKFLHPLDKRAIVNGKEVCVSCYDNVKIIPKESGIDLNELKKSIEVGHVQLNKPTHYHTHDIDTIEFLKRGFPPQVLTGFLIGNIIKYTQRFEYKNGEDDVLKIVDYAKRLQEWYKETHS